MNEVAVNDQPMTSGRGQFRQFNAEAGVLGFVQKLVLGRVRLLGPLSAIVLSLFAAGAEAQSFRVQCPTSTITHPSNLTNVNAEPSYTGPTVFASTNTTTPANGYLAPSSNVNGAIRCQQISGGDGYATMGDGTQTYMFSFGPLSGLHDIANGLPGTQFPSVFNTIFPGAASGTYPVPGDPATTDIGMSLDAFSWNGAVGLASNVQQNFTIYDISDVVTGTAPSYTHTITVVLNQPSPFQLGDSVVISQGPVGTDLNGYMTGSSTTVTVTAINAAAAAVTPTGFPANYGFQYVIANSTSAAALAEVSTSPDATASSAPVIDGHVDPRQVMDVGVMNGNIPAPLIAIDEDDELFLTLSNVGMIMRPDLFEQHTVHFHGYPNASAFYDGVPDASVAINIGASFTYYYLAPDAGTYFWHCHITPPEHLQMGMVGQLYVRPRQNRWSGDLYAGLQQQQQDLRTGCRRPGDNVAPAVTSDPDLLCSNPVPAVNTGATNNSNKKYAYNDGDGSTYYDVEVPLQMHGFDPNFHFVGMTFNPEGFADMKDKYFLLNGRSYPDTVNTAPMSTQSSDGVQHFSQPMPSLITLNQGQRALLRISELNVSEYHTLASLGIPMQVIGYNAKLLRDQMGNNMYYTTNSITLGGGESLDLILDTCTVTRADPSQACPSGMAIPKGTYYLYTPNLDHLSNDAENFGGQMTTVVVN